jgi:prevent-host-death family protein
LAKKGDCGYDGHMRNWNLRDAKDHLSELVTAAQDEPQIITRRGRRAAVVLSDEEYDRLCGRQESLVDFFARSGLDEIEIEHTEAAPREDVDL